MNLTDNELRDIATALSAAGQEGAGCEQAVIDKIARELTRRGIDSVEEPYDHGSIAVANWRRSAAEGGY